MSGALTTFMVAGLTDGTKAHSFVRGVLTGLGARASETDGKHQKDNSQNSARQDALRTPPHLGVPGERQRGETCTHSCQTYMVVWMGAIS